MTRSLVILLACSTAACASTVHDLDAHAPLPAAATPATIAPRDRAGAGLHHRAGRGRLVDGVRQPAAQRARR